jgi:hypothetical protein
VNRMFNKGIEYINHHRGWRTAEKIVVFESDDWGCLRTSSNRALEDLRKIGVQTDRCHYMMNDTLETKEDLDGLFNILRKYKDKNEMYPIFTFNTIMANPDFDKIRKSDFKSYYYEPFTETYKKHSSENMIDIWNRGILQGIIYPQFHGREHVNINRWINDLMIGRKDTMLAFDYEMFGISGHIVAEKRGSYLAVFDEIGYNFEQVHQIISEGLDIFVKTFGFSPKTFIAPNYVWSDIVEKSSKKNGIVVMQGNHTQILPTVNEVKQGVRKNYIGKESNQKLGYLIRNVVFEPSSNLHKDWVSMALIQIESSFKNKRPAIIDTHRVNYMGSLNPENRKRSLELLDDLISKMIQKWPDINFYHSQQLTDRIYQF